DVRHYQNSKTIGIILPPSSRQAYENPFYLEAIRGIGQFCNGHKYTSTVITGQSNEEILDAIQTTVSESYVDGFIVLYSKEDDKIVDYLYSEGFTYVLIGKAKQFTNETIYIDNDNIMAGKQATEYLISLGHQKIAYLGSESIMIFSSDRKAGYHMALMQNDLPIEKSYCIEVDNVFMDECKPLWELLRSENRPTAMVVSDDILAVSLERVCNQCGISIPEDLSIISFNDSLFAKLTSPQLTSIDVNSFQLGIEAASQLINHIENPNLLATKIIVPHRIIERDSCKKIF
ncbi:MAG: substrate-binding domain-containing protein, partial [Eubacterium sp.]|nr:substrate-binding domain-containing protein [Eubacterium sp.]